MTERRTSCTQRRWPLFAGVAALVAVAGAAGWWWGANSQPEMAAVQAEAVPSTPIPTAARPADTFLSEGVTLRVSANADVRDWPSATAGGVVRSFAAAAPVTGRWVQGADGASRWLRLVDGGYVAATSLTTPAPAAPPTGPAIRINISNQGCQWGDDLRPYFDRSIAARDAQAAASPDGISPEDASSFITVPNRSWRGLTVTAVAIHWESSSVYFREPVAEVRRVLRANGIEVSDLGEMPIRNEEAVEGQSLDPTNPEDRRYGASGITCGV